jgi:transcriptional regulator with XRE-family HTH domain
VEDGVAIGEALAEARGAAGLTVDEVSERTGIREVVIRGIERNDFNSLGGDLYVRGYLRAIARVVGIDPQPLIREFDAAHSTRPGAPPPAEWPSRTAATPTAPEPTIEPPAAQTLAVEVPAAEVPTVETPVVEVPAAEVPTVQTPIVETPAAEAMTAFDGTVPALDDTVPDWGPVPDWGEPVPAWGEHASMWGELEPVWADSATGDGGASSQAGASPQAWASPWAGAAARAARPAGRPAGPGRIQVRGGVAVLSVLAVVVLGVVGVSSAEIISKLGSSQGHAAAARDAVTPSAGATPTGAAGATAGQAAAGSATQASTPTPTPTPAPLPVARLAIRDVQAFGPDGLADGDNPSRAAYAITPGAPEPWRTEWYTTPDFGHLKQGTGLLIDMGRLVTITSVQIQLGSDWGADLQIRAGDAAVPGELPVVASRTGAGGLLTVGLRAPVRSRYVLLWWMKLPPTGSGTYRASVYGVVVTGRP